MLPRDRITAERKEGYDQMSSDETDDRISFYAVGNNVVDSPADLGPARQGFDELTCGVLTLEAFRAAVRRLAEEIAFTPNSFGGPGIPEMLAWAQANQLGGEPAHPAELVRPGSEAAERVREELLDVPGAPEASDRVAAGPTTAGCPVCGGPGRLLGMPTCGCEC